MLRPILGRDMLLDLMKGRDALEYGEKGEVGIIP
jgi:hypothetical protein